MKELEPIGKLYIDKQYSKCIEELEQLWNNIPHPKHKTQNSYMIISYFTKILFEMNRTDEALEWALIGLQYNGTRNLGGEGEFQVGKIAYETNRIELAKDMFTISRKKSGKRYFKDEKKEYYEIKIGRASCRERV